MTMVGWRVFKRVGKTNRAISMLWRALLALVVVVSIGLIQYGRARAAQDGEILSLTAVNTGNTVTVSVTVYAFPTGNGIQTSSMYFEIIYNGTVYRTHLADNQTVPTLNPGDTWTYSWTADITTAPAFPVQGTYTLTACWATGNSSANGNNCNTDSATTTFYSAPTLGVWFGTAALVSVVVILWRRRADFVFGKARS